MRVAVIVGLAVAGQLSVWRLARIYERAGDWDKCGEVLQKALALGPMGRDAADLRRTAGLPCSTHQRSFLCVTRGAGGPRQRVLARGRAGREGDCAKSDVHFAALLSS